jgi:hypothetical protein
LADGEFSTGGLTVIAADTAYPGTSLEVEYDFNTLFSQDALIDKIVIFAGHDGDGSRGFIDCEVAVDRGSGYEDVSQMVTGDWGDSPAAAVASWVSWTDPGGLADGVKKIKFKFSCVSHSSTGFFQEPNDNTTNPPANYPNQGTIIKEIDVFGELVPENQAYEYLGGEYSNADANTVEKVSDTDLLNGVTSGTITAGGFHPATAPGGDQTRLNTLTDGAWAAGGLTVIAADNAFPSVGLQAEYDIYGLFTQVADVEKIVIFAGHDGDGARGFINCDVEVDTGSGYVLADSLRTGAFGKAQEAAVSAWVSWTDLTASILTDVERVRFTFYSVSHNSTGFFQAWDDNTTNPPLNYPNQGTIIKEIDVFGTLRPKTRVDDWTFF